MSSSYLRRKRERECRLDLCDEFAKRINSFFYRIYHKFSSNFFLMCPYPIFFFNFFFFVIALNTYI